MENNKDMDQSGNKWIYISSVYVIAKIFCLHTSACKWSNLSRLSEKTSFYREKTGTKPVVLAKLPGTNTSTSVIYIWVLRNWWK